MVSSFTAASGVLFGSGLSMWRLPQEPQQSQCASSSALNSLARTARVFPAYLGPAGVDCATAGLTDRGLALGTLD